ncbi:crotonase/enoyl-CoA hydratase family protein [Kutzneria buriramensis]|uniref:Enoyl-CoA hydratase/carnithine racemase n=1 Tax=Kutzneria buriramensis TaxID=1045776 RepID=A0A3E0HPJ6_9PSEU|nr:crotonase/enoyl-CoA hydratase family protein [Kutzneria buriramensis]REH48321.1 enoyl-CoA hydratase/carnithine racemase [Kutzneria buriramensis]
MSITVERREHLLLIGLDRVDKRNSFTTDMLAELAAAYGELERDPDAWVGVLFAHGDHFTAGLDLAQVAPHLGDGLTFAKGSVDPWGIAGPARTKPVVAAAQGWCLTLGIELLLASDVRIAAEGTRFAQIEIQRGIYPFGGATVRLPQAAGWGNAMRWLLTGDEFDAAEAYRIGLVQEVVPAGQQVDRAIELASRIAAQAPLGVRATLASARAALDDPTAALSRLAADLHPLLTSADAAEGVQSFIERRKAVFTGK